MSTPTKEARLLDQRRRTLARMIFAAKRLADNPVDTDDETRLVDVSILLGECYDVIRGNRQTHEEVVESLRKSSAGYKKRKRDKANKNGAST